ncbi:MAG: hypothetical protein PUP90_26865 [Nostoc sp. S4]|nr:hypothetical protein [Nostoc sp. S4]
MGDRNSQTKDAIASCYGKVGERCLRRAIRRCTLFEANRTIQSF